MAASKKGNKKDKIAKVTAEITTSKKPVIPSKLHILKSPKWIGPPNIEGVHIAWRFSKADMGGPYHCNNFSYSDHQQLWVRLRSFEGMNSAQLKDAGSLHDIPTNELTPDAKKRLEELNLDDLEIIYSFKIDGPCRLWCMRYENIFCVLWWDRNHGAYYVPKKHT